MGLCIIQYVYNFTTSGIDSQTPKWCPEWQNILISEKMTGGVALIPCNMFSSGIEQ